MRGILRFTQQLFVGNNQESHLSTDCESYVGYRIGKFMAFVAKVKIFKLIPETVGYVLDL